MKKLTELEYNELLQETETIEKDSSGEKVLKYPNGNYLKLFRLKRLFSSALLYPYWKRFVRNSRALQRLNIPTVERIVEIISVPHLKKTGVIYVPLQGETLKSLLKHNTMDEKLCFEFGSFVASLHRKGVYFSSLHLGNVVLTEDGEFGLIDISDMRVVPFPIPLFTKKTNLDYLYRCRQGMRLLRAEQREAFREGYLAASPAGLKTRLAKFIAEQEKKL